MLFNKIFRKTLLFIFLAELLSFFGYLLPEFNKIGFLIIASLALILSLIKLEYGLWMLLAELFIGSKGYLFFFEHEGVIISIRIALWLVVMAVWLGQAISAWIKDKKLNIEFARSPYFPYFGALFIFIGFGLISGFLNHNEFSDIFFDFNGWLYFALVFPVYSIINKTPRSSEELPKPVLSIFQIFTASITWLCAKTFLLLFIFSHNIIGIIYELYGWTRDSGVGEITQMQGGFYRVFFQSHIFALIGFFIFLLLILNKQKEKQEKKLLIFCFLLLTLLLSVILISFSRSFWIGLAVGLLIYWLVNLLVYRVGWKKFFINNGILLFSAILSIGIIIAVVKFPYPKPIGGFSTTDLLSERAGQITGEAGVSSRWSLLPELWNEIKQAPILGQGFGAAVTYKSSDPRVLQSNLDGEYTTYAFEWGWLDIWLKLGFLGMLSYLILIGKICYDGIIQNYNAKQKIYSGLIIGLFVIAVVSIFSPYMNHPLGIGYLILASAILSPRNA
ncbi:O-antigen ligase family protein [Patescibacteria group bacterium]|nr:O-antigen ligase family protein [Patescibacteria group bacterium]